MGETTTHVTQQVVQDPSTVSVLTALSGLAIPATATIIFLIILLLVAAVIWGGFEFKGGYGNLTITLKKRENKSFSELHCSRDNDAPEVQQDLLPALPTKEIQAQATPPEDEEHEEGASAGGWYDFLKSRSVYELDNAYSVIKTSVDEESTEFWTTEYKKRRANYGADNGVDAVRGLISANPSWCYPFVVLLDWAIRDHDYDEAERYLNEGLKRQASDQFGLILSSGVRLKYIRGGAVEALRFCVEYANASIPERMKAGAFYALAEQLNDAGQIEGYRVALEWAVSLQPSDKGKVFSLAYNYAESDSHWVPAMWHYRDIIDQDDNGPVARNNLAILIGNFDKAAQIEAYEKAAEAGDLYAPANLANLLISDGYVAAGERMLKAISDAGDAAELHSHAVASAMAARRDLITKNEKIRRTVEQASKCYRASLARSFKRLQSGEEAASGLYGTDDTKVLVSIGAEFAIVRMRIGGSDYYGKLPFQVTCFSGAVSNRPDTILGMHFVDITLLDEGNEIVRLFQWPKAIGFDYEIVDYELRRTKNELIVPPTLPPPVELGNSLASAILGNRQIPT